VTDIVTVQVTIRPAPPYYEGGRFIPRTDVTILANGQYFGSRLSFALDDTPANRNAESQAFIRRSRTHYA
jgi:hypothetical protein